MARDARPDAKAYCVHCLFLASECSNILGFLHEIAEIRHGVAKVGAAR